MNCIEDLKKAATKSINDTKRINTLQSELILLQSAHQRLIDQNSALKNSINANTLMLESRNSRINELERSNIEQQTKQNQERKEFMISNHRLEKQWLEADRKVKELSMKEVPWVNSSKILKPLKGGAALAAESSVPQDSPQKRSSWYISLLKHNK